MGKFDDDFIVPVVIEDACPWCGEEVDERRASYDMWLEEHVTECVAAQMELRGDDGD